MSRSFSHRNARSAATVGLLCFLIIAETSVLHALLFRHYAILATLFSVASLWALVWLLLDYRALGVMQTSVVDRTINLRIGRRASATFPLQLLARAISPSWQELEAARELGALNLTKPAEPNVLLIFSEPVPVQLPAGLRRNSRALILAFDEPEAFLASINHASTAA